MFPIRAALTCILLAWLQPQYPNSAQSLSSTSTQASGQTVTSLPDGRTLTLGGMRSGGASGSGRLVDRSLSSTAIELHHPRAWHTATVLPDGLVLVSGGVDGDGRLVPEAELFDPRTATFYVLPADAMTARARASATLLTDGRVLFAGGLDERGQARGDAELWDPSTERSSDALRMAIPRAGHQATLTSNGDVVFTGGTSSDLERARDERFIATANRFSVGPTAIRDDEFAGVADSSPQSGETDVPVTTRIALRLGSRIRHWDIRPAQVALTGPDGAVDVSVIGAEDGRLLFVTPANPLLPGQGYTFALSGVTTQSGLPVTIAPLRFTTVRDGTGSDTEPSPDEAWQPANPEHLGWRTGRPASPWERSRPLIAAAGITAVSGRVLRLDGNPLPDALLEIEGRVSRTDRMGRFLIEMEGAPSGWCELWIDGRPASRGKRTHGTFEAGVHVTSGRTTVLPYTIWMPLIDTAHAVQISSPTTRETIVTSPNLPGLELRIPAGAVIRDHEGRPVTSVSLTPVPLDRPPFPLPTHIDVPIYFTIQPGGAYVDVLGRSAYGQGARLFYPNSHGRPPGTPMEFWHYDPEDGRGWYVYGNGAVTVDGRQIAPNRGVSIREFTGAMVAPPSLAPGIWPAIANFFAWGGDPVDLATGLFVLHKTDLTLTDVMPVKLRRTYRPNDTVSRSFGIGATHLYDMFLVGDTFPWTWVDLVLADGSRVKYIRTSPGTSYTDAIYEHTASPTSFFKSQIRWNGNGWDLTTKDGTLYVFREGFGAIRPQQAALLKIQDRQGNVLSVSRDASADIIRVTAPFGRWIDFTHDTSHRVTRITDNIGREVLYTYDSNGRLWKVTDAMGGVTEYTYDSSHRLLTLKDARGIVFLTNEYDSNGRISIQTQADGTTYHFAYTLDGSGKVTETLATDPRGHVRRLLFNTAGYTTSQTEAFGTALARTTTLTWQSGTNLLLSSIDSLSRKTTYGYDTKGNVTTITRLADSSAAVTTTATYEQTFSEVALITDPLGHTTTFAYDNEGNLTSVTAPLGRQTAWSYDAAGLALTSTNPMSETTQFTYEGSDLVSVSDPLGRTLTRYTDGAGRTVSVTNPLGQRTRVEYNAADRATKFVDEMGGEMQFTYDANANLMSLTDARSNTTNYTFDSMDRLSVRTDPLQRAETYTYDANGNLLEVHDRKSQISTFTYDAHDRLTSGLDADGATTTFMYDAGDRVTQIIDSAAGTITRSWDGLDRLTAETTSHGGIIYTYNSADRRETMTVAGQPPVMYSYDDADRLTGVVRGANSVAINYDAADRRTAVTLPNGIVVGHSYDLASQLTSLTYTLGAAPQGTLTYSYDLAGRRTSVGGTWARTALPLAMAAATYDQANQILAWDGTPFTYDANGNLTSDGSRTYAWNARDQLVGLGGSVSASFAYDGVGRRRSATVSGTTTNFLHDGLNNVQELSVSGAPTTNLLTGLTLDETFMRTEVGGGRTMLADALGSTIALTDEAGLATTEYAYAPFGAVTVSGASSANRMQFAGRENDDSGVYYYRARYYHPQVQRFVSEDPLDFSAGDPNLYSYVFNAPTVFTDPTGATARSSNPRPPIRLPPGITLPPGHPNGPPPIPLPDGHVWRPVEGTPKRPVKWVPSPRIKTPTGSQPQASWDDVKPPAHWDYDAGDGSARRHVPPAPTIPGLPWRLPFPLPVILNPCFLDPTICTPRPPRKEWT